MTWGRLSRRTAWQLSAALRDAPVDLTVSNPTRVGLRYDDEVYRCLGDPAAAAYEPAPLGSSAARKAVASYYRSRDVAVDPSRVWLTASTSEAYAQLFALVCDPSDSVLVPRPGYGLLECLADAASVELVGYALHFDGRWTTAIETLEAVVQPDTRAVVVVAPNNPTGNFLERAELDAIAQLCARLELVLIVDEVFADYPLHPTPAACQRVADPLPCLTFVLSGLSKVAALPQMKLSWAVVHGPEPAVTEALRRAELLADAYLSVGTPVQHALPRLLDAAAAMQDRIRARIANNVAAVDTATAGSVVSPLPIEGGWTALLRMPEIRSDVAWAEHLARDAGVRTQPGALFGMPAPPRLAVSLLTPEPIFADGLARLIQGST